MPYGLGKSESATLAKKPKLLAVLAEIAAEAGVGEECAPTVGILLFELATKAAKAQGVAHRAEVAKRIGDGGMNAKAKLDAALKWCQANGAGAFDGAAFDEACGVGVAVSAEMISAAVAAVVEAQRAQIDAAGWGINVGLLNKGVRDVNGMKWADGGAVKQQLEAQLVALLGPKVVVKKEKKKKEKKPKAPMKAANTQAEPEVDPSLAFKDFLPDPKANVGKPGAGSYQVNTPEQLAAHLEVTNGRFVTRFPPEPNGYLHIGHAKAMNFNFGQAKLHGGVCYMRFDDTNPAAEKQEYIDSILGNVQWLGHKPWKTTYSSAYFQQLYDLAVELVRRGKAYVCHMPQAEVKASREVVKAWHQGGATGEVPEGAASPYRERPIEENLRLLDEMRRGLWDEGAAVLRMKGDLRSPRPEMSSDHMAYRVKFEPHPHSKDAWCIYPTYDYTHCLVDSIENVTHSLCTLEFETRQAPDSSYHWLLEMLGMYHPYTWESSRCNVTYNVLSKRKLNKLVMAGHVSGWDDPRLLTLDGLRRRGYTAASVNKFCMKLGITRANNNTQMNVLEGVIREELNVTAPRAFGLLNPLKVTITNYSSVEKEVSLPNSGNLKDTSKGARTLPFGPVLYIDASDFQMENSNQFFGLAPGKEVHLLFAYNIKCTEAKTDAAGNVTELLCEYDPTNANKTKGHIQWLPEAAAATATINLYDRLFTESEVDAAAKAQGVDFLELLNPESLKVVTGAMVEPMLKDAAAKPGESFQFLRVGYFTVDKDSTADKPVYNRIVALREAKDK